MQILTFTANAHHQHKEPSRYAAKKQIWIDSSGFLMSPSINYLLESKESSEMCQRDILQMTKSYLCTNSLSFRGESDSSLSGRRRDQRVRAPQERNSQGSVPASRTPVVEHNDTHPRSQSIHAIVKLQCVINFNSLPYLVYCTSNIHSLKKRKSEMGFSDWGLFSFFFYNYGLEGYQLNASNYRMLRN